MFNGLDRVSQFIHVFKQENDNYYPVDPRSPTRYGSVVSSPTAEARAVLTKGPSLPPSQEETVAVTTTVEEGEEGGVGAEGGGRVPTSAIVVPRP
jgi:hypothetical protein